MFLNGFCLNNYVCSHFKQISDTLPTLDKYFIWTLAFQEPPPVCIKTCEVCIMPCPSYTEEARLGSHSE